MKAVKIPKPGYAELIEIPDASAGPGRVVVKVHATGICGSDIAAYNGTHGFRVPPVITGHELSGIVTEVGEGVRGVQIGDRVAIEPQVACGKCDFCRSGHYNVCPDKRVLGATYWTGSFAESVVLPPSCLYEVPPEVSMPVASLIEPFCVGLHAVERARIEPGDNVAVLGSGTIGLMTLLGALQQKPGLVVCSDLRPFNLEMARSLGATNTINPKESNFTDEIEKATDGRGIDVCLLAAQSTQVIEQAFEITRPLGRIVAIAMFEGDTSVDFKKIQAREREVMGTFMYTHRDYLRAIELFPKLKDSMEKMITHRITMERLPKMLDELSRGQVENVIKVVVEMAA